MQTQAIGAPVLPVPAAPLSPPVIGIAAPAAPDAFLEALLRGIEAEAPRHQATLEVKRAQAQAQSLQQFFSREVDAAVLVTNQPEGWAGVLAMAGNAEVPVLVLGQGVQGDANQLLAARLVPDLTAFGQTLLERAGQRGILELQTTGVPRPFWRDRLPITVLAKQSAASLVEARRSTSALANVFGDQVGLAITYDPQIRTGAAEALAYHNQGAPVPVLDLASMVKPAEGSASVVFETINRLRQGERVEAEILFPLVFDIE